MDFHNFFGRFVSFLGVGGQETVDANHHQEHSKRTKVKTDENQTNHATSLPWHPLSYMLAALTIGVPAGALAHGEQSAAAKPVAASDAAASRRNFLFQISGTSFSCFPRFRYGGLERFPSSHVNVSSNTGLQIGYPRAWDRGSGFLSIPINFTAEICISLPRYTKRVSRGIRPNSRIVSN